MGTRRGRASRLPPLRAALRNRALVRVLTAVLCISVAEWALWIAVIVDAHARGGAGAAGLVTIVLIVPAALVAPAAGAVADGRRPNRVLVAVHCMQVVALVALALGSTLSGSTVAIALPAAVVTMSLTLIRPCLAVIIPGLVATTEDLTAGNLLDGYVEGASVLIGPLLAGGLLAVFGTSSVYWSCVVLAAICVAATWPLLRLDAPVSRPADDVRRRAPVLALAVAVRDLASRHELRALVAVLSGQYVLIGGLDLIYVVLAVDELHLGASAPGLLAASFGVGAVAGGIATTAFVGREGIARWTIAALFAVMIGLSMLAGLPTLASALVLFPVIGLGRAVLDLTGRTLLQRSAPPDALATTFAVLEGLALACSAVGAVAVQILVVRFGVRGALVGLAAILAALLVGTARSLLAADATADVPVVAIRQLRRIPLFALLPGPSLEGVARAAAVEHLPSGSVIVREAEPGDRYYAITRGDVDVTIAGRAIRTMHGGEGFGEIALLADIARTATVTAHTDVDLLSIGRAEFLVAVLGHDASAHVAWRTALAFEPSLAPHTTTDNSS